MLRIILPLLLAILGGAGGHLLREWELSSAFETTGLAVPGTAPSIALIALSIIMALLFAVLCKGFSHSTETYREGFSAVGNWAYLVVCAFASACLLIAALLGFRADRFRGELNLLRMLLWLMCLVSFVCILLIALSNFSAKEQKNSLTLLAPAYACCLWLITAYQQRAADPVVLGYMYEMFAIICTLLSLYSAAGFSFGRIHPRRCAFFGLLGIYLCIVALADTHDRAMQLLFLFALLYLMASTAVLLRNIARSPRYPLNKTNKTQEVIPDE